MTLTPRYHTSVNGWPVKTKSSPVLIFFDRVLLDNACMVLCKISLVQKRF
jgi:hypothetical protein